MNHLHLDRGPSILVAATALLICGGQALAAPQFRDFTAILFPADPNEYTNQASVVDLENDGDLDIAWANGRGFSTPGTMERVRLYINDGTAHFTDETDARTGGLIGHFRGVEFGDIDNDGDMDMILANDFNKLPRLLVNDGNGFFTDETVARLPNILLSSSRAQFGDIDDDGDMDIYVTSGGAVSRFGCGQNRIYVNNGSGVFADETAARHPLGNLCEPQDAIFGDVDADYDLDVRTASTAPNQSRLYLNDGSGVYTAAVGMPGDNNCYSYDFGDIDGDGDIDLLGANGAASGNNSEILLANNGLGGFVTVSGQISPNLVGADDNDSKFIDYDNDGDLDLVIARLGGQANVQGERLYQNDGSGNFTQILDEISINLDSTLDIMVADFDNNGTYDMITAQGESGSFTNRYYINTGPADTIPPTIVRTQQLADTPDTVGPYVVHATVADSHTSDRNFFDKGIFVNYSVNGGAAQQVAMQYSGGMIYRGEIPGQACGGTVEYFVTAIDWNDNLGTGSTLMFDVTGGGGLPPGDINGDCTADLVDVELFVGVLLGTDTDPTHVANSDLNGSGGADGLDTQFLVDAIVP